VRANELLVGTSGTSRHTSELLALTADPPVGVSGSSDGASERLDVVSGSLVRADESELGVRPG